MDAECIAETSPASPASGARPPRIIALMNQKGGVGKTTTTVNLAAAFAERGRRVLVVDLDPQAHLTLHFGLEPDEAAPTVYDLLLDPDVCADAAVIPARERLDVILAEVDLAAAEVELAGRAGRDSILRRKLEPILSRYEIVMFDCPPSLGLLTLSALSCAGEVLIPMQAHFLPLQGVGKLLETVALVRAHLNPALEVGGVILCAHEGNTTLAREIVADLESFFEQARDQEVAWRSCRVLEPAVRRNIKLAEAPSFGQTIFDYAPWCAGANDYRLLAEGLESRWFASPARPGRAIEVKGRSPLRLIESDDIADCEPLIPPALREEIEALGRELALPDGDTAPPDETCAEADANDSAPASAHAGEA